MRTGLYRRAALVFAVTLALAVIGLSAYHVEIIHDHEEDTYSRILIDMAQSATTQSYPRFRVYRPGDNLPHWLEDVDVQAGQVIEIEEDDEEWKVTRVPGDEKAIATFAMHGILIEENDAGRMLIAMAPWAIAIALVAWLFGIWLLRRLFRPLASLARDCGASIPGDEVERIAATLQDHIRERERERDDALSFARDVSHDLRTPLMAMVNVVDVANMKHAAGENISLGTYFETLQRSCRRMDRLLTTYLALYLDSRTDGVVDKAVPLREALQQCLVDLSARMDARRVSARMEDGPEGPEVPQSIVTSLATNILRNATDHAPGCSVTIECSEGSLRFLQTGGEPAPTTESDVHVGAGMRIIERLCDYLGWRMESHRRADEYVVELTWASEG